MVLKHLVPILRIHLDNLTLLNKVKNYSKIPNSLAFTTRFSTPNFPHILLLCHFTVAKLIIKGIAFTFTKYILQVVGCRVCYDASLTHRNPYIMVRCVKRQHTLYFKNQLGVLYIRFFGSMFLLDNLKNMMYQLNYPKSY